MYLNCHSYYSLRYGTMSIEQLIGKARAAGVDTVVLTDIDNSTGIPEFAGDCVKNNIRPVAGIEFRNGNDFQYIGIARNNRGLQELNEFLSELNFNKTSIPFPAPQFSESYVIYSLRKTPARKLYDNERIGIRPNELNSLLTLTQSLKRNMMVLLMPVTFAEPDDILIHRSLRAVDNNILLSHLRQTQCAGEDEFFKDQSYIEKIRKEYPWLADNTMNLLDDCDLQFDRDSLKNKKI